MAYDRVKIYEQAQAAIFANNLYFIEDIIAFIPCTKPTFYDFFPVDSDEFNALRELLDENKIKTKVEIRNKLSRGEKAAELLSLYRLICTNEERQMLNQQYIDHTTKGKEVNGKVELTDEQLQTVLNEFKPK